MFVKCHQINNTFKIDVHLHGKPGGVDNHAGSFEILRICVTNLTGVRCSGLPPMAVYSSGEFVVAGANHRRPAPSPPGDSDYIDIPGSSVG